MAFGAPPQMATATEKPRAPKSEMTAQMQNQAAMRQKAMAERGAMSRRPPPAPDQLGGAPLPPMGRKPPPSPDQLALQQRMRATAPGSIAPGAPRTMGGAFGGMGAKPPAPMMAGGPFGMRQFAGGAGPFGAMTKAPMQTGQANPFAGAGATRIPGDR